MSQKIKVIGLALVAVLAFSALAACAAQASAPRWKVATAFLAATKTKTFTAVSTTEVKLTSAALNLKIAKGNCDAHGTIIGSGATEPGTATFDLRCTEVKVTGFEAKCTVNSPGQFAGVVTTQNILGTLVWLNEEQANHAAGLKVKPDSGTNIAEILVSGSECPVANVKPYLVAGEVLIKILPSDFETEVGELISPEPPFFTWWNNATPRVKQSIEANRLKLGKEGGAAGNATFGGTFSLELSPKEKFGIFAG